MAARTDKTMANRRLCGIKSQIYWRFYMIQMAIVSFNTRYCAIGIVQGHMICYLARISPRSHFYP